MEVSILVDLKMSVLFRDLVDYHNVNSTSTHHVQGVLLGVAD